MNYKNKNLEELNKKIDNLEIKKIIVKERKKKVVLDLDLKLVLKLLQLCSWGWNWAYCG